MRIHYQRLMYAGTIALLIVYASAIALLLLSGGCAIRPGYNDGVRRVYDVSVYAPFDNSRDWGPSYLIGPPGHHFGFGARVDDRRSREIDELDSTSDPKAPVPTRPPLP
jgi:hypothetical protein